jgi:thiol:disulfide interchange protein DsbD
LISIDYLFNKVYIVGMKRSGISLAKYCIMIALASLLPAAQLAAGVPEPSLAASGILETDKTGQVSVKIIIPEGYHQVHSDEFFTLSVTEPKGTVTGTVSYPEGVPYEGETAYYGEVLLTAPFTLAQPMPSGGALVVEVRWQLCSEEGTCYRPEKEVISFEPVPPSAGKPAVTQSNGTGPLILLYILFAIAGGIILNFMPCVLPILSIKAMGIVRQGSDNRKAILAQSAAYAAGIIISFFVLALVVVLLKASGRALGWGFQFQNIPFVLVLTLITFLFSLSLFGVFEILPPRSAGEGTTLAQKRGGLTGSFLTGLLAVLLATPCTAPFLGAAMGFAFTQPAAIVFILFLATGVGFSLPFLLLGLQPKLFKLIPKPGPWMEVFKKLMGFVLAGTTLHLVDVLFKQTGQGIIPILWFLMFAALAAWIWGEGVRPDRTLMRRILSGLVALVLLTVTGVVFLKGVLTPTESSKNIGSVVTDEKKDKRFSEQELMRLTGEGQTVFVHFTADWCLTCKTNERTVLSTRRVEKLFEDFDVQILKGDLTHEDPAILAYLQKNGRAGVPFYQLHIPDRDPVLFPEILTAGMLERALSEK